MKYDWACIWDGITYYHLTNFIKVWMLESGSFGVERWGMLVINTDGSISGCPTHPQPAHWSKWWAGGQVGMLVINTDGSISGCPTHPQPAHWSKWWAGGQVGMLVINTDGSISGCPTHPQPAHWSKWCPSRLMPWCSEPGTRSSS